MVKENGETSHKIKELKIKEERIGFVDDFTKIAVFKPEEIVSVEHHKMYEKRVNQHKDNGYKIIYTPKEELENLTRKKAYDILDKL